MDSLKKYIDKREDDKINMALALTYCKVGDILYDSLVKKNVEVIKKTKCGHVTIRYPDGYERVFVPCMYEL